MKRIPPVGWLVIGVLGLAWSPTAMASPSWLTLPDTIEKTYRQASENVEKAPTPSETASDCGAAQSSDKKEPSHWLDKLLNYGGPRKGTPIPFHSIEGYSGGAITPMAYLCNHCQCGTCKSQWWKCCTSGPSVAYSYMDTGNKDLHTVSVVQCFGGRLELGYALNRLSMGSLHDDIRDAGLDPVRKHIYMHNFNARFNLVPEGGFDLPWMPAITAGVHFKYNQDVSTIDGRLGKALSSIGYARDYGVDYTLVASKMFIEPVLNRPLFVSAGLRFTKAAQLGLLGFGKNYHCFFEGNVAWMPTDWLVLGYELRMKESPYDKIPGLIGEEDNWHAFSASVLLGKHLTVSALYGLNGHVANSSNDQTVGLQIKYEF